MTTHNTNERETMKNADRWYFEFLYSLKEENPWDEKDFESNFIYA